MKITKDIFLKATAEAMATDSAMRLFKADPHAFDMFTLFSFCVFKKLDGKDVTEVGFSDAVAEVIAKSLPEDVKGTGMLKSLALIIFSTHIWEELEKTGQTRE